MKTLLFALLLTASLAFVLLGCSDDSNPVLSSSSQTGVGQSGIRELAKATVVHQEWKEAWSYYGDVSWFPCLGEGIQFSGTYHFVTQTVTDGKGGFHSTWHYNRQDVVGVSDGGTIYHQTGGGTETVNLNGQVGEVYTHSETVNFIGQGDGKGNDYTIRWAWRYIVNSNGEVKVDFVGMVEGCKK